MKVNDEPKKCVHNDEAREEAFFNSDAKLLSSENPDIIAFEEKILKNLNELVTSGKSVTGASRTDESGEKVAEGAASPTGSVGVSFASGSLSENSFRLGLAVSGGADSVCLLVCVASLCKKYGLPLKVCTVNHRIRLGGDSEKDALFVSRLCERIKNEGLDIEFYGRTLEEGEVFSLSEKRGCGVEEAARSLRYQVFEDFRERFSLDYVLLAHNQNDNLETILMRFLQGSFSSGIKARRDFYIRPLYSVSRSEIESYLNGKNVPWRTDSTNFDDNYFRNRIRHSLIPLLDEKFPGWKKSVSGGAERLSLDEEHFEGLKNTAFPKALYGAGAASDSASNPSCISYDREEASALDDALLSRLFYDAFPLISPLTRVPFRRIQEVISRLRADNLSLSHSSFEISMRTLSFGFDLKTVYVKKPENVATDSCFFAIIEKTGFYEFPFGSVSVEALPSALKETCDFCDSCDSCDVAKVSLGFDGFSVRGVTLPFVLRTARNEDELLTSTGEKRNAKSILSSWHIPSKEREMVPVLIELSEGKENVRALLGGVIGSKNWINLNESLKSSESSGAI